MPLQNRVYPTGEIVADPARGLMMGNRGCLHGQGRELGVTRWRSKLWICCVLDWKDVRRDPMPPGRWTALFFLDEATALAAGHRPCAYCRRGDYLDFAEAWQAARALPARPRAAEMDRLLHAEREPGQWFASGRDNGGAYYSPLTQINDRNISRLGFAWEYRTHTQRGLEATPVVVDGVMYASGNWGAVYALNAATGQPIWRLRI